jgi:murein DD-endopeptidase MepM/ murein hydrolase activator NlpD
MRHSDQGGRRPALLGLLLITLLAWPAGAQSAPPALDLASGRPLPARSILAVGSVAKTSLVDALPPPSTATAPASWVHPIRGAFNYGEGAGRFGDDRGDHVHEGQDVFAKAGTPLVAVTDAVVIETGNDGGRGNYVAIYSAASRRTYMYLHMISPAIVGVGSHVRAGQRVGAVGCTGSCFGDHLHFEMRLGRGTTAPPADPLPFLTRLSQG